MKIGKQNRSQLILKSGSLEFLIEIVALIRPVKSKDILQAEKNLRDFIHVLSEDKDLRLHFRDTLIKKFESVQIATSLSESGIIRSRGFIQELLSCISYTILPEALPKDDFLYLIEQIFNKRSDYVWVEGIDRKYWSELFDLLQIDVGFVDLNFTAHFWKALQRLSYQLANASLNKEISLHTDFQSKNYFVEQNKKLLQIELLIEQDFNKRVVQKRLLQFLSELRTCKEKIKELQNSRNERGTSLGQTFIFLKMMQVTDRMLLIVDILLHGHRYRTADFLNYFTIVVRNQNNKNSITHFYSQSISLLAYQIAEHKGRKGNNYIAFARNAYRKLFVKSLQGGFVVSFMSMVKCLIIQYTAKPILQGVLYSFNYGLGFMMIDQTGSTLATKQPSYTASTVAKSLDKKAVKGKPNLHNLSIVIATISRSMIISFIGNLLIVFPLAYFIAYLYHTITGNFLASPEEAMHLIASNHPWQTLSFWYAAIAGLYLFLSGLVVGYVENYIQYARLPDRICQHPRLRAIFSKKKLNSFASLLKRKGGAFAGSISLGVMLGMTAPIGKLLSLPLDVRHITIGAGNTAIGFFTLKGSISISYICTILLGLSIIGFLNFLVSFSLAFYVGVRSREIQLKEYSALRHILMRYIVRFPGDFMYPPKKPRSFEELF